MQHLSKGWSGCGWVSELLNTDDAVRSKPIASLNKRKECHKNVATVYRVVHCGYVTGCVPTDLTELVVVAGLLSFPV